MDNDDLEEGPAGRIRPLPDRRFSRSLEYGLALLECFSAVRPACQISELADALEISRSTTHRYAQTLQALERLERDRRRRYRLAHLAAGPGLAAIGAIRRETPAARRILEDLREQTGHTVSMATLDGTHALYLQRFFAHGVGQYAADLEHGVGAHVPLHCTAIGKALLASLTEPQQRAVIASLTLEEEGPNTVKTKRALAEELDRVRATGGIATCDEEQAWGVRSIAAAIPQSGRSRPLAVSVTVPTRRYTLSRMITMIGPQVRAAAERI
jgi:IclR family pca regulon transcriptional regulator